MPRLSLPLLRGFCDLFFLPPAPLLGVGDNILIAVLESVRNEALPIRGVSCCGARGTSDIFGGEQRLLQTAPQLL